MSWWAGVCVCVGGWVGVWVSGWTGGWVGVGVGVRFAYNVKLYFRS